LLSKKENDYKFSSIYPTQNPLYPHPESGFSQFIFRFPQFILFDSHYSQNYARNPDSLHKWVIQNLFKLLSLLNDYLCHPLFISFIYDNQL